MAPMDSPAGRFETIGATALGVVLPLGLIAASALLSRRPRAVSIVASLATLAGSAVLRTSMLSLGHVSASRPECLLPFFDASEPAREGLNVVHKAFPESGGYRKVEETPADRFRPATPRFEPAGPAGPCRSVLHRPP